MKGKVIQIFHWSSADFSEQQKLTVFKPPRSDLRKLRELALKRAREELCFPWKRGHM